MPVTIQQGFNTTSGLCTITGTESISAAVTVQKQGLYDEWVTLYRVRVLNASSGLCVKKFKYENIALKNTYYDWYTPYFSLLPGTYIIAIDMASQGNPPAGTFYAINGQVLVEVSCSA